MFLEKSASIWNFRSCLRWPRIIGQKDKSADSSHLTPQEINDLEATDGQILVVASYVAARTTWPPQNPKMLNVLEIHQVAAKELSIFQAIAPIFDKRKARIFEGRGG